MQGLDRAWTEPFKVDITFNQVSLSQDSPDHLGQVTTEMVLQWIQRRAELQQLVIVMKAVFKQKGLNQAFLGTPCPTTVGGLSSFSLIILVNAFLLHYFQTHPEAKPSLGLLFLEMIDFFANKFDRESMGVSYFSDEVSPFIELPERCPHRGITIVSPISQRPISANCHYFDQVADDLRAMLRDFDELTQAYVEYFAIRRLKRVRRKNQEAFNARVRDNFIEVQLSKLKSVSM